MTRIRSLKDTASGKSWATHCDGAVVKIRAGTAGKEKESEKALDDTKAAEAYALREEMARLRKGFVLVNPAAKAGEPRMHRLISRAYTGALVVAAREGKLLANAFDKDAEHDRLLVIGADAEPTEQIDLPKHRMARKLEFMPGLARLLVQADHQILSWSLSARRFDEMSKGNQHPACFLSAAGSLAAWYDEPDAVVTDLASGTELLRRRTEPEKVGGHSLQMEGALSPDGSTLALCSAPGRIALLEAATGAIGATLDGDFAMVEKLVFTADGRCLLIKERYGKWRLLCFELATGAARPDWPPFTDHAGADLAIDPSGRRLAIAHRGKMDVFDFASMTRELSFSIDHVVKRCAIGWIDHDLGVLTDQGCASLYATR
jgi:hypothetical protein